MQSTLVINEISLLIHLGCHESERRTAQLVKVRVKLTFPEFSPIAIKTDELGDTVCYGELTEKIKAVSAKKEFKLIEHLAGEFFNALRSSVDKKIKIDLELTKINPPLDDITGGVTFIYGESASS